MAINSPVPASRTVLPPRQLQQFTRGITRNFGRADDATHTAGMLWYPEAHDLAVEIGRTARVHGGGSEQEMSDPVRGAGLLSALSPQIGWEQNMALARQFARYGKASGQTGDNKAKARAIREGVHPSEVLNPKITGGTSHKTWNFFQNIAEPDDPYPVTIDRHAHDLAVGMRYGNEGADTGERGLSAAGRYNNLAEAYRRAGDRLGVRPNEVQATTWLHWRQQHGV